MLLFKAQNQYVICSSAHSRASATKPNLRTSCICYHKKRTVVRKLQKKRRFAEICPLNFTPSTKFFEGYLQKRKVKLHHLLHTFRMKFEPSPTFYFQWCTFSHICHKLSGFRLQNYIALRWLPQFYQYFIQHSSKYVFNIMYCSPLCPDKDQFAYY